MQKLNCAPGDLAIVIGAKVPDNIGQIVLVIGSPSTFGINEAGHVWHVRAITGRKSLIYRYRNGKTFARSEGPVPDRRLRPVSGLQEEEEIWICDFEPIAEPSASQS